MGCFLNTAFIVFALAFITFALANLLCLFMDANLAFLLGFAIAVFILYYMLKKQYKKEVTAKNARSNPPKSSGPPVYDEKAFKAASEYASKFYPKKESVHKTTKIQNHSAASKGCSDNSCNGCGNDEEELFLFDIVEDTHDL